MKTLYSKNSTIDGIIKGIFCNTSRSLKNIVEDEIENLNIENKNQDLRFDVETSAGKIVDFYRTYNGSLRKMHPMSSDRVEECIGEGFPIITAKLNGQIAGAVTSRKIDRNYPYFSIPSLETQGDVYTIGGLYVGEKFVGNGIANKIAKVAFEGTKKFSQEQNNFGINPVISGQMAEVAFDNYPSLWVLSKNLNFVGCYNDFPQDKPTEDGLSVLLYTPFVDEVQQTPETNVKLYAQNEFISSQNIKKSLENFSQSTSGVTSKVVPLEDDRLLYLDVLNKTPLTASQDVFIME